MKPPPWQANATKIVAEIREHYERYGVRWMSERQIEWLLQIAEAALRERLDREAQWVSEAPPLCSYCGTSDHLTESPAGERCREREARDAIQGQHLLGPDV